MIGYTGSKNKFLFSFDAPNSFCFALRMHNLIMHNDIRTFSDVTNCMVWYIEMFSGISLTSCR